MIITLPAAVGLAVLAEPILVTLFQYEAFTLVDVDMSGLSLAAYALGLPAFIAVKVLAPGFYARQDTRTPVRIAIIAMVSNMVMNVAFVGVLVLLAFRGPHTGLALASSIAAYLNAGFLYRGLRRQGVYQPAAGWSRVFVAVFTACAVMTALLLWQAGDLSSWAPSGVWERALRLLLLVVSGMVAYVAVLLLAGLRKEHLEKGSA